MSGVTGQAAITELKGRGITVSGSYTDEVLRNTLIAARQLAGWQYLSEEDDKRLAEAVDRIDHAAAVLVEAANWKPEVRA